MNKKYVYTGLILLCMIFSLHIGNGLFKKIKYDVTDESLYSLSEGTSHVLAKIVNPVEIKLFYSKTAANKGTEALRQFNNHFFYVKDLLMEYASKSGNQIKIQVIDPRPDTDEEEAALTAGLKKFQITGTENYFFGLVAEANNGKSEIIEFLDPNEKNNLEFQITKMIYKTQGLKKSRVGVLSAIPMVSKDDNPYVNQMLKFQGQKVTESWFVIKMLKETSDVEAIAFETDDISNIELLIVVHPKAVSPKTISAIEKFVARGGKLLVLVDPNLTTDTALLSQGIISTSPDTEFNKLLNKFGIDVQMDKLAGDKSLAGIGQANPGAPPMKLLPLLGCNADCTAPFNDVVTAGLEKIRFIFPGVLQEVKIEGAKVSTLLSTTAEGNTYQAGAFEMNHPEVLMDQFKTGTAKIPMAMKSIGKWGEKESAVIVIADVDFIEDQFAFQQTFLGPALVNDNPKLFLNAVDVLLGSTDLLMVRAKGVKDRTFDVINKIENEADTKTQDKVNQINQNILVYQSEIDKIGKLAEQGQSIALLKNESLKQKKELDKKIISLKKELREVKRAGREHIEVIGKFFQFLNTLLVPILLVIFGLIVNRFRNRKYLRR